jgi:hypothetical protein
VHSSSTHWRNPAAVDLGATPSLSSHSASPPSAARKENSAAPTASAAGFRRVTAPVRTTPIRVSLASAYMAGGIAHTARFRQPGAVAITFMNTEAIAAALRVPLAELAGLPAESAAGSARMLPRVRHGIEFSARDDSNGELRVTGDGDAAVLLWAAAWLDEHRDWTVTGITFRYPAVPGHEGTTATVVFELASPGMPSPEDMRPRLGPWPHGGPPDARVRTLGSGRLGACRHRQF